MTEEQLALLRRADDGLEIAQILIETRHAADVISHSYYAMFYAVLALLGTRSAETSRHSGAIPLFARQFVKPGAVPRVFCRSLHDGFSERQDADYGTDFGWTPEDASESVRRARQFVAGVRELLQRQGDL